VIRRALLVACVLALAGCATADKRVLHFGVEDAPEGKRILWPQPPDVPRYMYAGVLLGEQNFRTAADVTRSRASRFFRWLVGLDGREDPVVLQRPSSGAVDAAGRILVTDTSRGAVFVFDPAAGELLVWESAEGVRRFRAPAGIAATPQGVLVADADLGIVARLDPKGTPLPALGRGALKRPTGVTVDPASGRIYVADTYAHDIKVFDRDGALLATLGRRGEGDGEFNYPTHLAFADGELYVTDTMNNRVQVLDAASGQMLRALGSRGLYVGNLVRPKGIAVDTERNVYVVESYYDHLLVFNRKGEFLMGFGGVGLNSGRFYLPAGVWTDPLNRVFVADMFNGRVAVFQFLGGGADGEQ
jgi:DNA-binding beta-propeller fold protein YncE